MIAADTSSLSALLKGDGGQDVQRVVQALSAGNLCISPIVLTEILSDPTASFTVANQLSRLEILEIKSGYWERAGINRRTLKSLGLKCKIADALVAQSCIDHDVALITRNADFRHFAKHCGLKLA